MILNDRGFWLPVFILCIPMIVIEAVYVIHTYYEYLKNRKK